MFLCRSFKGWGTTEREFSGMHGPNFTKLGENIGRPLRHCTMVSEFGYLAAFLNMGGSNLSDVEKPRHRLRFCWARSIDKNK